MLDLRELADPERKEIYFSMALERGADGLDDIVYYYEAVKAAMIDVGFDDISATVEAAESAYRGLANVIKSSHNTDLLDALDDLDKYIREVHDIHPVDYPVTYADPLVASFYKILSPHLLKTLPGDRIDTWNSKLADNKFAKMTIKA